MSLNQGSITHGGRSGLGGNKIWWIIAGVSLLVILIVGIVILKGTPMLPDINLPTISIPKVVAPQVLAKNQPTLTPIDLPSTGFLLVHLMVAVVALGQALLLLPESGVRKEMEDAVIAIGALAANYLSIMLPLFHDLIIRIVMVEQMIGGGGLIATLTTSILGRSKRKTGGDEEYDQPVGGFNVNVDLSALSAFLHGSGLTALYFGNLGGLGLLFSNLLFSSPVSQGTLYPLWQIIQYLAAKGSLEPVKFSITAYAILIAGNIGYFIETVRRHQFDVTLTVGLIFSGAYLISRIFGNVVWWAALGLAFLLALIASLVLSFTKKRNISFTDSLFFVASTFVTVVIATGY